MWNDINRCFIDRVRDYEVDNFKYKLYIILGLTYNKWQHALALSERKCAVYTQWFFIWIVCETIQYFFEEMHEFNSFLML